jgi:hypothetical protein
MPTHPSSLLVALAGALLGACQETQPAPQPIVPDDAPRAAAPPIVVSNATFAYLLERYDADGDAVITQAEYTRHDGQLARWDRDGDGHVTEADWAVEDPQVSPQIDVMQRLDVLGRYFQTDENELEVLTIDELAGAFLEYDATGTPDEELTEAEFLALADERAVAMPGDGSMMGQSYIGEVDGWGRLTRFYDLNGSNSLDLTELTVLFEEADVYELRFDQVRFDDGDAGAHFDQVAYREGLTVGSSVPDVTLTTLHGDEPVSLAQVVGTMPVALIFGSYT